MGNAKTINMSALEDARFVRRIVSQDVAAFERLYDDLSPGVYGFLLTVTPHETTAERLLVETFHRAWKMVPGFRGGRQDLQGWLMSIASALVEGLGVAAPRPGAVRAA